MLMVYRAKYQSNKTLDHLQKRASDSHKHGNVSQ